VTVLTAVAAAPDYSFIGMFMQAAAMLLHQRLRFEIEA